MEKRNVNIDLLRIFAICCIVIHHYIVFDLGLLGMECGKNRAVLDA